MVFTLLLVPLRETICFHLRRALYCSTQHFFFSQRAQPTNTEIQRAARDPSERSAQNNVAWRSFLANVCNIHGVEKPLKQQFDYAEVKLSIKKRR